MRCLQVSANNNIKISSLEKKTFELTSEVEPSSKTARKWEKQIGEHSCSKFFGRENAIVIEQKLTKQWRSGSFLPWGIFAFDWAQPFCLSKKPVGRNVLSINSVFRSIRDLNSFRANFQSFHLFFLVQVVWLQCSTRVISTLCVLTSSIKAICGKCVVAWFCAFNDIWKVSIPPKIGMTHFSSDENDIPFLSNIVISASVLPNHSGSTGYFRRGIVSRSLLFIDDFVQSLHVSSMTNEMWLILRTFTCNL